MSPNRRNSGPPHGLSAEQMLRRLEQEFPEAAARVRERRGERSQLGDKVFLARSLQQLTQAELAERAGVRQTDISAIERGRGNQTRQTLEKVGRALGLQLDYTHAG